MACTVYIIANLVIICSTHSYIHNRDQSQKVLYRLCTQTKLYLWNSFFSIRNCSLFICGVNICVYITRTCMSLRVTAQSVYTLIQVFPLTTHLTLFISVIELWVYIRMRIDRGRLGGTSIKLAGLELQD
jgi:hypothetical protein